MHASPRQIPNRMNHNRQTYDAYALQYHKKRTCEEDNLWNLYLDRPMIQNLMGGPATGTKVLDLGCGSGLLTRWLKNQGLDACGVDFSSGLIDIARGESPDIDFTISDINSTPYANGSFDIVVSGLVMHYMQDLGPVFAEVARILGANGVFVFTMHHPFDEVMKVAWKGKAHAATLRPYFHNDRYTWTMLEGMRLVSYHHTFEAIVESLFRNGFTVERMAESRAADGLRKRYPRFHARTNQYPSFCGFRARVRTCSAAPVPRARR